MHRPLTSRERGILDRLFECEFPGRDTLQSQLDRLFCEVIDECDGLRLRVEGFEDPWGMGCPIARGEYLDEDDVAVCIVLHVRDGQLSELEIYKEDGSKIINTPHADRFVPTSMRGGVRHP
jgi:hypothetical protein